MPLVCPIVSAYSISVRLPKKLLLLMKSQCIVGWLKTIRYLKESNFGYWIHAGPCPAG